MEKHITEKSIELLKTIFYKKEVLSRETIAMTVMELFMELKVFENPQVVAIALEKMDAIPMLEKINLFDVKLGQAVEGELKKEF